MKTSIVDVAKKSGDEDLFQIDKYKNGLTNFIKNSDTPITIALQGEWGSGKTSLMNSIHDDLCIKDQSTLDKPFYGIWINTWQYSLMKSPEESILRIVEGIISQVLQTLSDSTDKSEKGKKISGYLLKLARGGGKFLAKQFVDKAGGNPDYIDDLFGGTNSNEAEISELKNEIHSLISEVITKSNKKGYIFFIDDLDRIDPPIAVQILELLKNIFDLDNCVFVLAIDYDVVIKGLEPKFGKLNANNEREFRSFFDKIIQMPFSMPVSNYVIDKFLEDKLIDIDYFTKVELNKEDLNKNKLLSKVKDVSLWTVGSNPRSLKRLINSLSLINCINQSVAADNLDTNEVLEKVINFTLVSIQIAYPPIYNLLAKEPNFITWDEKMAIQMNLPAIDEHIKSKLILSEDFNDEWEQILFRICEKDAYLQKNALNISRLLNFVFNYCSLHDEPNIGEVIAGVISLSSVTNLEANDKPVSEYHRGNLLKSLRSNVLKGLRVKFPENKSISAQGARVQSNAYLKFTEENWGRWFKLFSHPHKGKIRLMITTEIWWKQHQKDFAENLKQFDCLDTFQELENRMKIVLNSYGENSEIYPWEQFIKKDVTEHKFDFYTYLIFDSVESFNDAAKIEMVVSVIAEMNLIMNELIKIQHKIGRADNYLLYN